jgi:hypothetical protein
VGYSENRESSRWMIAVARLFPIFAFLRVTSIEAEPFAACQIETRVARFAIEFFLAVVVDFWA